MIMSASASRGERASRASSGILVDRTVKMSRTLTATIPNRYIGSSTAAHAQLGILLRPSRAPMEVVWALHRQEEADCLLYLSAESSLSASAFLHVRGVTHPLT